MKEKSTREKVVTIRQNAPHLRANKIAEMIGVTPVRIGQILKAEGLPTKVLSPPSYCEDCGVEIARGRKACASCRKTRVYAQVTCNGCGKLFVKGRKIVERNRRELGQRHWYCSRACYYAGRRDKYSSSLPDPQF